MKKILSIFTAFAFVAMFSQKASAQCAVPGDLQIHHTATNAASLSWDPVAGAGVQYIWRWRLGAFAWVTSAPFAGTTVGVGGLTTNQYEFQVSSFCGGIQSAWSPSFYFRGLGANCGANSWEANNGSSNCPTLWAGETANARSTSAGDLEYFRVLVSGGCIDLALTNIPAGTNYDLILFQRTGGFLNTIGFSYNTGNTSEFITLTGLTDGDDYFARISLTSGSSASCFTFSYDNTCLKGNDVTEREGFVEENSAVSPVAVKVSPNPATHVLNVNVNAPNEEKFEVKLVNMIGETVEIRQMNANSGAIRFDISSLAKGMYLVEVRGANWKQIEKIVVN